MALQQQLEYLQNQMVALLAMEVQNRARCDPPTAAHALSAAIETANIDKPDYMTVESWFTVVDAAVMTVHALQLGFTPCLSCTTLKLDPYLHRLEDTS